MVDIFWYYAFTLMFICIIVALLLVYRYFLGNKLNEQANKLKSQMAKMRQDFPELGRKPNEFIADTIGNIGIEGIMGELGIDPGILKNPLVKGLIEKYAPRILEQATKGKDNKESSLELL